MSELPQGFVLDSKVPEGFVLDPPDEEKKLSFLQRVEQDLDKRREMYWTITDAYLSGEQSYAEGMLQVAGKVGAGAALDFIGNVVISGGRGLSAITPDAIEDPIKGGAAAAGMWFLDTAAGKKGLKAAHAGIDKWQEFKDDNPRAARNIEAVVDIAVLAAPAKGRIPKQTKIGDAGDSLLARSARTAQAQRTETVEDLIRPKRLKGVREAEVQRTTEAGLLRQKRVALSEAEKKMAQEVAKVKGVSHGKTLQANYNAIAKEVKKESDWLKGALEKNDFIVPRREFRDELAKALARLQENPLIVGDAAKVAERIIKKMDDLADINKSTGSGLLQARKELDAWARSQKGPNIFDPKLENSMSIALREIRQTTNNFIANRAAAVNVKRSLKKQSTLLQAMSNIAPKAADEAANMLLRLWHRGLKLLPLRGEFNQAMAAVFGVGGLGASAMFAPAFTKLAFGAFGSFAAYRLITGPGVTKTAGTALKAIDKMIIKATDKNIIRELRADRALLLEIMKMAEEELE